MAEQNPPGFLQNAGSTHNAAQLRNYVAALTAGRSVSGTQRPRGGVHPKRGNNFSVSETGTPSMAVEVNSGLALVSGTESTTQGGYWVYNDATITESVDASHATLNRIDIVVLQVRDAFYSGANNDWIIDVVAGTPASSPVPPTAPANSLIIAEILVVAASTSVVNANITDKRDYLASVGGTQFGTSTIISGYDLTTFPEGQSFFATDTNEYSILIGSAREPIWYGNLGQPKLAIKTSDQNLATSSTTMQNVTSLSHSVVSGTYFWRINVGAICTTSNTPDVKFGFTFPTSTSQSYLAWSLALAVTGPAPYSLTPAGGSSFASDATIFTHGLVNLRVGAWAQGHITFTASGTMQLRAAQNTSAADTVTITSGSSFELTRAS